MNISDKGLALIQHYEGCKLTAYPDPGTGGDPWTIGIGHTGPEVHPGMTITQDQATEYLRSDCAAAEQAVNRLVRVDLSQDQFDALVCFVFNVGAGNFEHSTLLRLLNAGDYDGAAGQFHRWDKAAGRELPGLLKRRLAEASLFNGEYTA